MTSKNVLVIPCATQIGVEQYNSLKLLMWLYKIIIYKIIFKIDIIKYSKFVNNIIV